MQYRLLIREPRRVMKLFGLFLLLKLALEYSYIAYLHKIDSSVWPLDYDFFKYVYGLMWFTALFFGISNERKLVSTFFLQFLLVFQILPLTVIYALTNENTLYYSVVCFSVALCEWMALHMATLGANIRIVNFSQGRAIIVGCCFLLFFFLAYVYYSNGLPTMTAVNIFKVYKLRASGIYQIGKYAKYLQALVTKVIVPILLTKFLIDRRYIIVTFLIGAESIIYLYTGHKSQLFMLFLVMGTVILAMKDDFSRRFWRLYCGATVLTSILAVFSIPFVDIMYSLFVRRILFVTAQLSFYHYDFFSTHPLLGMSGIFPRWLLNIRNPYEGMEHYTHQIGWIYYGHDVGSNNGFFSEGYSHFGFGGILLNLVLFALVLKLVDGLQAKAGYAFALGCCVNVIFGLGDGHLLGIFGYMGAWILFLLLYRPGSSERQEKNESSFSENHPIARGA